MKISVIYHSENGNYERIAEMIAEGARLEGEVEVKSMSIDEIDQTFAERFKSSYYRVPHHRGALFMADEESGSAPPS